MKRKFRWSIYGQLFGEILCGVAFFRLVYSPPLHPNLIYISTGIWQARMYMHAMHVL